MGSRKGGKGDNNNDDDDPELLHDGRGNRGKGGKGKGLASATNAQRTLQLMLDVMRTFADHLQYSTGPEETYMASHRQIKESQQDQGKGKKRKKPASQNKDSDVAALAGGAKDDDKHDKHDDSPSGGATQADKAEADGTNSLPLMPS